jgi:hypothetical protein
MRRCQRGGPLRRGRACRPRRAGALRDTAPGYPAGYYTAFVFDPDGKSALCATGTAALVVEFEMPIEKSNLHDVVTSGAAAGKRRPGPRAELLQRRCALETTSKATEDLRPLDQLGRELGNPPRVTHNLECNDIESVAKWHGLKEIDANVPQTPQLQCHGDTDPGQPRMRIGWSTAVQQVRVPYQGPPRIHRQCVPFAGGDVARKGTWIVRVLVQGKNGNARVLHRSIRESHPNGQAPRNPIRLTDDAATIIPMRGPSLGVRHRGDVPRPEIRKHDVVPFEGLVHEHSDVPKQGPEFVEHERVDGWHSMLNETPNAADERV